MTSLREMLGGFWVAKISLVDEARVGQKSITEKA